jgi:hypothetical protein
MFIEYKTSNKFDYNSVYEDVIAHSKKPETRESRYTNVHETSHYISSELRSKYPGSNGFYFLNNQAVIINQPKTTIEAVSKYVPKNLRGIRYKLYFNDQLRHWNNEPLYILEELNCYLLGGMCAVRDNFSGLSLEKTDAVAGMFEFKIYVTALAMCIKEKLPEYWDLNDDLETFIWLSFIRVNSFFPIGRNIPSFKSISSDKLYSEYNNSKEGDKMKEFILKNIRATRDVNWSLLDVF